MNAGTIYILAFAAEVIYLGWADRKRINESYSRQRHRLGVALKQSCLRGLPHQFAKRPEVGATETGIMVTSWRCVRCDMLYYF